MTYETKCHITRRFVRNVTIQFIWSRYDGWIVGVSILLSITVFAGIGNGFSPFAWCLVTFLALQLLLWIASFRQALRYRAKDVEVSMRMDDESLTFESPGRYSKLEWANIERIGSVKDATLLFFVGYPIAYYTAIPNEAFSTDIRKFFAEKFKASRKAT